MRCIFFLWLTILTFVTFGQTTRHDLHFDSLAKRWDEAMPLGNAMVGALVWQKDNRLRFSLDRADLWDLRPMKGLHRKEFSYKWVQQKVQEKDYKVVQQYFDAPYDMEPAPTKIPAGALEFNVADWGRIELAHLSLRNALCEVKWSNGSSLETFVHATEPVGWFRFTKVPVNFQPLLVAPAFQGEVKISGDPVGGDDLSRLGYKNGEILNEGQSITYKQEGWGGFTYEVKVRWKKDGNNITGVWSISSQYPGKKITTTASVITSRSMLKGYKADYLSHLNWWKNFWAASSIKVPDSSIEKQWYLEQYKFGSASRKGAPPISLQAVWTADNGRIPPWKGDYHHDLNTQLSYWPSYSGNHLEDAMAFLDHLDENKANYKRFTKLYFETDGLAVPGVTTLDGTEMGGWIQYSLSPTASAWLAHHYYLQWRYSMDKTFLKTRAYPWIKDVALFLENITVRDENGFRQLPISSSPEINNNSINAWFDQNTNYDLALMKFTFKAATEIALELGLKNEAERWKKTGSEFNEFAVTKNQELMFAPTMEYNQSHRHFSHALAIHPLGLIRWEDGNRSHEIIKNTIGLLDKIGPDAWCGYSYTWLANMKARAKDGEGAAKDLEIFIKAFCSINSFHLNGDQTKSGYSKFVYRPFTLEGNFAFASGLQEMLLQSYAGFIEIMPAIPAMWNDVEFNSLRAEGAFLVSGKKKSGAIDEVKIVAEKGGNTVLKLPFSNFSVASKKGVEIKKAGDFLKLICKPGGVLILKKR
ncbi:MAG: hypothetical protein JWQ40_2997 [Segetibacter sp.]|nr:hypothetical protein [Segetibacter sp.]